MIEESSQIKKQDLRQVMSQVLNFQCSKIVKIRFIEGHIEKIKNQIYEYNQLVDQRKIKKQENLSTELSDDDSNSQEEQLWEEIDKMEQEIVQKRIKKIELNQRIEQLEDQFFQVQRILVIKKGILQGLKADLKKNIKKFQLKKQKKQKKHDSKDNSLISKSFEQMTNFMKNPFKTFWN